MRNVVRAIERAIDFVQPKITNLLNFYAMTKNFFNIGSTVTLHIDIPILSFMQFDYNFALKFRFWSCDSRPWHWP